jgi:NAD+ synthetase
MIDYKKFVENSRKWLSKYIQDNHLQSLIIGVSGGVDSTVSACLASPVCKELNIPLIGRSLPTTTNKPDENSTAQLVGKAFCTDFKEVNISAECQKLIYELELNEGDMSRLQEGNIKARVRMIYLRHLASLHKGVVLDNDNFTEWNLGFWTVGGDSPMDINLGLHYLWKTEIYELANYLYDSYLLKGKVAQPTIQSNALLQSIKLIPTDGNGVSNSDCEQFGLDNYEQVDDVLKTMYFDENHAWDTPNEKGDEEYIRLIDSYNEQGVDKVMVLHQNTEYKRKELPIKPTKEELGL